MVSSFTIKQGDTLEQITGVLTYADGTLITRTLVGAAIRFHMRSAAGVLLVDQPASTIGTDYDTTKRIGYQWRVADTAVSSSGATPHQAEFQVTYADGNIETFPNGSNININIFPQVA